MLRAEKRINGVEVWDGERLVRVLTIEEALQFATDIVATSREAIAEHSETVIAEAERVVGRRAD